MKVLMVCLGNICRSPLAEGIFRKQAQLRGLGWEVDSAGTGSWHVGEAPDPRSIQIARQQGLDISDQRARQIRLTDLSAFDYIFAMDRSNYRQILELANDHEQRSRVHLFLDYAGRDQESDVPDPYWNDNGFQEVYHMLDQASHQVIDRILDQSVSMTTDQGIADSVQ
ncbi:MAG: low molecular weight phosphotyrosine protein phosphatase [Saprospiraceae bacterium]|nr:low molecular weight phosphotyrosine protein phosphatase [Saprospiraceae bacterium]